MRGTRRLRWIIVMCRVACILLASLASACSPSDEASPQPNPTSPTLPTPPAPPASSGRLQMSGRVLDQNGTPLPGASSRSTTRPPEESAIRRLTVLWRASAGLRQERTTWASIQSSSTHEPGRNVDGHVNWVSSTLFTTASKSTSSGCRMAPLRRFGTCGSVPRAAFLLASRSSSRSTPRARSAQTSRIYGSWTSRCELVVIESGAGILNIEARPAAGGPAPSIFWYTTGNYAGFITRPAPGAVAIPVRGGTYRVLVAVPEGAPSQQFNVTTTLR